MTESGFKYICKNWNDGIEIKRINFKGTNAKKSVAYIQDKEQVIDGSNIVLSSESYVLFCLELGS